MNHDFILSEAKDLRCTDETLAIRIARSIYVGEPEILRFAQDRVSATR